MALFDLVADLSNTRHPHSFLGKQACREPSLYYSDFLAFGVTAPRNSSLNLTVSWSLLWPLYAGFVSPYGGVAHRSVGCYKYPCPIQAGSVPPGRHPLLHRAPKIHLRFFFTFGALPTSDEVDFNLAVPGLT